MVEFRYHAFGQSADISLQSPLIYGTDLLSKDKGIFIKPLYIAYLGMGWQLCFCLYSARYRQDNDRRAVRVSYIVGNDKDGSPPALLRADNGVLVSVVDVPTPDFSFHICV